MTDATSRRLGERVSQLRQEQGLTLEQLAAASGVSRSMLSQIERGRANPTLAVTQRIAQTFGISIGELVDDPGARVTIDVVRGDDPGSLFRADGSASCAPCRRCSSKRTSSSTPSPAARRRAGQRGALRGHAGNVHGGRRRAGSVRRRQCDQLDRGDTAHYRADVPHASATAAPVPSGYLVVSYR
jgi:DNA-binding XRE family transcriptional regulator